MIGQSGIHMPKRMHRKGACTLSWEAGNNNARLHTSTRISPRSRVISESAKIARWTTHQKVGTKQARILEGTLERAYPIHTTEAGSNCGPSQRGPFFLDFQEVTTTASGVTVSPLKC